MYERKQDVKNAFYYQNLYIQLRDSINQIERQTYLIENEFYKKEKQALSDENNVKQAEIAQKNAWLIVIIFLLLATIVFALLLFRSMNQKKEAYQVVLHQRNEIAAQNEKIMQQAEHLQRLNQTKAKILAIISHDFRSPIANLQNALELFENQNIDTNDILVITKKLRKNIGILQHTLDTLLHWAYAQMDGLQTQKKVFDIQQIILELDAFFALDFLKKNIAIDYQVTPHTLVYADPDQVMLILRNLIANAIKFNPKNGKITLWAKEKQEEMLICVSDTGVGISSEKIKTLFKEDKSTSTKGTEGEKGTGLGLLLCKEFVEKNGGTIWVESEIGRGAEFYFTLPLPTQKEIVNPEMDKSPLTLQKLA
ncbi:MAG: hypothetical protein OHK0057_32230 [Thermoflexibacter sp.]